jgi:hypothetical protein
VASIDDRHQDPLPHAVLVARTTAVRREHELVDAGRLALGARRVQLLDEIEAEVDLSQTGRRLGFLDDEPLMRRVDGAPPECAHLPHPEPGLRHRRDHRSPADAVVGSRRPVELAGDHEQLGELVTLTLMRVGCRGRVAGARR